MYHWAPFLQATKISVRTRKVRVNSYGTAIALEPLQSYLPIRDVYISVDQSNAFKSLATLDDWSVVWISDKLGIIEPDESQLAPLTT
jgi:hypothetical protein